LQGGEVEPVEKMKQQGGTLSDRWVCLMAPQQPVTNYSMNFEREAPSAPQLFYACPCIAHKWSPEGWVLGYAEGKKPRVESSFWSDMY
jgi:hypothetical protein